jgi:uncharacterized membrane protein
MKTPSRFESMLHDRSELIQSFKAKMDRKRTPLERFADRATELLGSNVFLFLNILWFAVWIIVNVRLIPHLQPFDPYPFGFLTMAVSLEAIILAILVLISQNRSARIADMREEIQLQVNIIAEEEITKIIELLAKLLEKNNIDVSKDSKLQSMLKPTNPEKIEKTIDEQINHTSDHSS